MCDLLFEIAAKDDDIHQSKSRYLNKHIANWIQPKENSVSKKENSINSTSRQCTPMNHQNKRTVTDVDFP